MWVILSLISGLFSSGFFLTNQHYKVSGHYSVLILRALIVVAIGPVVLAIGAPDDPVFYAAVLASTFAGALSDIRVFNLSAKYGAGVAARLQPVSVVLAFFLWPLYAPATLEAYAAEPARALGILAAICGCAYFAMRLKKCAVSMAALREMVWPLLGYTLTILLNKISMDHAAMNQGVYGYMFFQSLFAVPLVAAHICWRGRRTETRLDGARTALADKTLWLASFFLFVAWAGSMAPKMYAVGLTDNPSYVAALILTTPFWIALWNKWRGLREEADVASGLGIVVCAMVLAALTLRG